MKVFPVLCFTGFGNSKQNPPKNPPETPPQSQPVNPPKHPPENPTKNPLQNAPWNPTPFSSCDLLIVAVSLCHFLAGSEGGLCPSASSSRPLGPLCAFPCGMVSASWRSLWRCCMALCDGPACPVSCSCVLSDKKSGRSKRRNNSQGS